MPELTPPPRDGLDPSTLGGAAWTSALPEHDDVVLSRETRHVFLEAASYSSILGGAIDAVRAAEDGMVVVVVGRAYDAAVLSEHFRENHLTLAANGNEALSFHETGAKRILVTHGNTQVVSQYLREQGFDSQPLGTHYTGDEGSEAQQ